MINKYIGVPWVKGGASLTGADCWGIITLYLLEAFGIKIKKHAGTMLEGQELSDLIGQEMEGRDWEECGYGDGVVVVMYDRVTKRPEHVGVGVSVPGCKDRVLHSISAKANGASALTPLRVIQRAFLQLRFFRYAGNSN